MENEQETSCPVYSKEKYFCKSAGSSDRRNNGIRKDRKKTYKCKVRVVDPKLNSRKVNLKVGEAKMLKVQGGNGTIKWRTNSPAVASVSKGKVTAKKAGEAKITAVCNGKTMVCTVKVKGKAPAKNEGNNSTQPTQPQGKKSGS